MNKLKSAALIAAMTFMFAGCGQNNDTNNQAEDNAANNQVSDSVNTADEAEKKDDSNLEEAPNTEEN